jgi:hypothetical protein
MEAMTGSGTMFYHGEIFRGLLLPVVRPVLRKCGLQVYRALNNALKKRVEAVL